MGTEIDDSLLYKSPSQKLNTALTEDDGSAVLYIDIFKESDINDDPLLMEYNKNHKSKDVLSFSDRVFQERCKLRRNDSLPQLTSSELYGTDKSTLAYVRNRREISYLPIRRLGDNRLIVNDFHSDSMPRCDEEVSFKYIDLTLRINEQINQLKKGEGGEEKILLSNIHTFNKGEGGSEVHLRDADTIKDFKISDIRSQTSVAELENARRENVRLLEEIALLKGNLSSIESDLIIERKYNDENLKDKMQLQNKINLYMQENNSLISSQEIMQNMHRNEVDELNNRKLELSNKILTLEKDLDYFRGNLQQIHKLNENLKIEVNNLMVLYKDTELEVQRLRTDNKRLLDDVSIYKVQNQSLIDINNRLRCRTLFKLQHLPPCDDGTSIDQNRNYTVATSPSNGFFNINDAIIERNKKEDVSIPHADTHKFTTLVPLGVEASSNYLSIKSIATPRDCGESNDLTSSGIPEADLRESEVEVKNAAATANQNISGEVSPSNGIEDVINRTYSGGDMNIGECINVEELDDRFNLVSRIDNTIVFSSPSNEANFTSTSSSTTKSPRNIFTDYNSVYSPIKSLSPSTIDSSISPFNPTTKWVKNHVSRHSSIESLQKLKEKIKEITLDERNHMTINVNAKLKSLNSSTIDQIRGKLDIISQKLNNTAY